jgi:repressor LexA
MSTIDIAAPQRAFGLTARQRDLLSFIEAQLESKGIAPSYGEMMSGVGFASKNSVHRLVHALRERGHIDMLPNRARSIIILEKTP